jgi:hypothetical protein
MKVSIKRWIQRWGDSDSFNGSYKTTITIYSPSVTVACTFDGNLKRKRAIELAWRHLAEEGRWSPSFLGELKKL